MADVNENRQVRQQIVEILLPFVTTIQDRVDLVSGSWNEQARQQYEINYEGAGRQFAERFISESLIIGRHLGDRDTSGLELVMEYICGMVGVDKQAQINRLLYDLRDDKKMLLRFHEELLPFEPDTIPIPAGPFLMGSDLGPGIPDYETPQFEISLPGYRIGRFPVTNEAFAAYVWEEALVADKALGWQGNEPRKDQLKLPLAGVTWYEALAYCQWLSTKSGRNYQLANEAQWEKAARGPDCRLYPWGDEWQEERCNTGKTLTAVDAYAAQSPYGCYDLVGNAREWTISSWGTGLIAPDEAFAYPWKADRRNHPDESSTTLRVYRGGRYTTPEGYRCSTRGGLLPGMRGPKSQRHGFRLVLLGSL